MLMDFIMGGKIIRKQESKIKGRFLSVFIGF